MPIASQTKPPRITNQLHRLIKPPLNVTAKVIILLPSRNRQRHKAAAAKPRSRPRTLTQRAPCRPRSNIPGRAARVTLAAPARGIFSAQSLPSRTKISTITNTSPSPPPP